MKYTDAWYATFVSAMAIKCGLTDIIPTECACGQMSRLFQKLDEWQENDAYTPQPGDVIFYDWHDSGAGDNTGAFDHVGIVESVSGSTMRVIEGNMSNAVGRRTLQVNGRYIRGYGLPKFKGGTASSGGTGSKPASDTGKKTVAQLADEVLAGKWGNGADRKSRLTAAGYDYDAVQSAVNAKLSGQKAKKSNTEIAKEVIAGKWGNGADRRKRLEAAGYNYAAVQAIVNKLIG